ncbi:hypothetical protein BYT27DRAFT_7192977 [Phlegmacium glaucopus]|nr:hypothetical protein BYT27DRAFT_7192977 [Phlegmacium glaucopus]
MSSLSLNPSSDSTNLAIPKLRDDGSNWADYEPRIQKAMGSKGLWRHVEGTAIAPKPFAIIGGVAVLADRTTSSSAYHSFHHLSTSRCKNKELDLS